MKQINKFFVFLLFVGSAMFAQKQISGTVTDSDGLPLPSASVTIEGTTKGTTTDFDGLYNISANEGEVLVVSYVGFLNQRVTVGSANTYNVKLAIDESELDEIVVVGYGTQKKRNVTGALETVKFGEELNQPVTNSGQLLYGRFSGVQLTQSSGNPGADGSSIVIRGIGTFGNTTPLIIIDNIQYDDLQAFNNLAPQDIANITVLKDASASAIYGARAANGVILVETKKGKEGQFQVNYNTYYGSQEATVVPDYLGALDYANLINEKFENQDGPGFIPRYSEEQIEAIRTGSMPDQFADTDWTNAVLQAATVVNHNLSISGGSKKSSYRFSLGYIGQDAIVKSKFRNDRYNMSFNFDSQVKDWLRFSSVTNSFWRRIEGPSGGQNAFDGDNGIIFNFQRTAPTIPLFYSNGEYGFVDGAYLGANASLPTQNPLLRGNFGNFENDIVNISQRVGLEFKLSDKLTFETSGSANIIYNNSSNYSPRIQRNDWEGREVSRSDLNTLSNGTNFEYRLLQENILRYNTDINEDHSISLLAGHSIMYYRTDNFSAQVSGFPSDILEEFNAGGIIEPAVGGGAAEEVLQSFFGRVNYNFQGKYLAEFNIRRDGSSKFSAPGLDNLYGVFPSASAGWNISEEDFMQKVDFINNLKLRASWGLSGNDRTGNYIGYQTYNPGLDYLLGEDTVVSGVAITAIANPFIRWEETEQYNIGLDISLIKNRLEIVMDYFERNSKDILYDNFPIPNTIGVTNLRARNSASMNNTGFEFGANFRGGTEEFRYSLGGNFTKLINNEVTGLGEGGEETISNQDIIRIGQPFGAYFGYVADGIFQDFAEVANHPNQFENPNTAPGDIRYVDVNDDGVIDQDDRTVIGNPNPQWLVNFNASAEYKNFDISFLFQGVFGVDRLFMGNGNLPMPDDRSNVLDYWVNRWTPENPSATLPRLGGQNNSEVSSFYIEDASYLRLKNFEIGYSIPKKIISKYKFSKFRVYAGGQNLLTFTDIENFDPEGARGRFSNRNVPLYRIITVGINAKF
jgi:TonB-linked SusC/RagA family outer membrane protein